MSLKDKTEHALITIYGDNAAQDMARAVSVFLPDRDVKVLAPDSMETLETAAKNSVLVFIGLSSPTDSNLNLGRILQENPAVSGDVIAFYLEKDPPPAIQILARGFDNYITTKDASVIEFKQYLAAQINKGIRRLERQIQEDEYRRLSNALAIAPVSLVIFDADKRAVFVSDHYFRAYPKIAPRLIRGLRVYDAFEMMAKEEGLHPDDERYEKIQRFWHNLNGSVEFTLDDGRAYKLQAEKLPGGGTVVMGRNMSSYYKNRA